MGRDRGLGSIQNNKGETIHKKIDTYFDKHKTNNIKAGQYGNRLLGAALDFSSMHI